MNKKIQISETEWVKPTQFWGTKRHSMIVPGNCPFEFDIVPVLPVPRKFGVENSRKNQLPHALGVWHIQNQGMGGWVKSI